MARWGRVLTAMVTPFDTEGRIDEPAVARLVDHLFETGTEGLIVCGTTGESPVLSSDEKLRMFDLARCAARGRGPIIAGVGSNDTAGTVSLARKAADLGVDGLLLVTPYYNKPSQEGLYQHFRAVAQAADLPVMLYNVPGRTSVNMEAATSLRLARDLKNVVAVKEASGNLLQATDIVVGAPAGLEVFSGEDGLVLPMLAIGATGVVSVTAHRVGRQMRTMHDAFFGGDLAGAARIHAEMLPVVRACFQSTTPSPVPLKAGLEMLGVPCGAPRLPLVAATEREREIMRAALEACGLL